MQSFWQALKLIFFMTLLTGVIYPLIILLSANLTMPWKAQGSIIMLGNKDIGSKLIGQKFSSNRYFWGRPSAVNYATLPSGASDLGPTSAKLKKILEQRRFNVAQVHSKQDLSLVPTELICASCSGIDPHISLGTAYFQIDRILKERYQSNEEMKSKIQEMIYNNMDKPIGRLFGSPNVNVLLLNLALDEYDAQHPNE